ncbi:MAG: four helix bundle protein [Deltaproteobacteria bacterium]|nr:MAG: four helix bundle protein [Deltaproteobacteria bacterium]
MEAVLVPVLVLVAGVGLVLVLVRVVDRGLACVVDARLRDQLLRASKSVCLNIAEAVGRLSDADRKRVYAIARGECCEAAAAIDIARAAAECDSARGRTA